MLRAYQSIYVTFYRWTFRNFGQGKVSQSKALFNASFLMILLLTGILLAIDILLHAGFMSVNPAMHIGILLAMGILLILNHFIFLNNRLLRRVDQRLTIISRHSRNLLAFVVLLHVILICGFLIFTVR
ncbi:MAG: hypothetical protein JSU01_14960 [Bacteroidetes bacterium]|nr:hypothetical protein [Bacteroidota bacterium]